MEILKSIESIRSYIHKKRLSASKVGFVPTMGALHEGHLDLVKNAINQNDVTIVSIFINPKQFNKKEDLLEYPSNITKDVKLLKANGCDVLFLPNASEVYPEDEPMMFNFGYLENLMEGKFRPGHFSGVGLIVSKLFNIVQPDKAYFGNKDLQQLSIVKKLVRDLNFNIEIIGVPTVREKSGLAMSSRNLRLSELQKKEASIIFKSIETAKKHLNEHKNIADAKSEAISLLKKGNGLNLEYFEIVNSDSLLSLEELKPGQPISICVAVLVDQVRLIDNISFTI